MVKRRKQRRRPIKFGGPDRLEIFLILAYFTFLYLFNDMVNLISNSDLIFKATGSFINNLDIPILPVLWISLVLFHVFLFSLVVRSILIRGTHHVWDSIVGMFMFIGVFLVLIATTLTLQGLPPDFIVPWFFDLSRNTIYHIGLILFQIPGAFYFALTK